MPIKIVTVRECRICSRLEFGYCGSNIVPFRPVGVVVKPKQAVAENAKTYDRLIGDCAILDVVIGDSPDGEAVCKLASPCSSFFLVLYVEVLTTVVPGNFTRAGKKLKNKENQED